MDNVYIHQELQAELVLCFNLSKSKCIGTAVLKSSIELVLINILDATQIYFSKTTMLFADNLKAYM